MLRLFKQPALVDFWSLGTMTGTGTYLKTVRPNIVNLG